MLAHRLARWRPRLLCRWSSSAGKGWKPRFADYVPVHVAADDQAPDSIFFESPAGAKCLHITVLGAPNAGKSMLMNRIVDREVSAVSSKYHTTRARTIGVHTEDLTQLCLYDTPGIVNEGNTRFQYQLIRSAKDAVALCDLALITVDVAARLTDERRVLLHSLLQEATVAGVRPWLVLNKMDLVLPRWRSAKREEYMAAAIEAYPTLTDVYIVSARHGTGIPKLKADLLSNAKESEWLYPAEISSSMSTLTQVAELVRAKLFKYTFQEVPYQVTQRTLGWQTLNNGVTMIHQQLEAHTQGHYRILKSKLAAKIEQDAQQAIADALNKPVRLILRIVLKEDKTRAAARTRTQLAHEVLQ